LTNWKVLLLCPVLLLLSSCSGWNPLKQIEVKTIQVDRVIPTQERPRPLKLSNIKWYVVTDRNFKDFKTKYQKENGEFLFYVISVRDYETLALNMAELQRYIGQQKQIIVYYEKAVSPKPVPQKDEVK
jgi:hypothetical protein